MTRAIAQPRKALDDDPRESKYIETVSKRGYRFIARVTTSEDELQSGVRDWKRTAAFAGFLILMPFVTLFWDTKSDVPEPIESLVVLPFESASSSVDVEYLADGIAESLIHRFSRITDLKVIARTTAFRFRDSEMDPLAVGQELGVEAVLLGKVVKTDEGLQVGLELIEVKTGFQLWGENYRRDSTDILSAQRHIAHEVLGALRIPSGQHNEQDWSEIGTDSVHAYLRGRYILRKHHYYSGFLTTLGRHDEAIDEAERAVELDPQSPSLNHNLGMVLYFARDYERAIDVFEDVVALEPNRGAARACLAGANWYSGDREKAITMVKEFDPVAEGIMSRLNEGKKDDARAFFESVEHRLRPGIRKALWFAWVERWSDVLDYLEESVDDRRPPFALMAFPGLDPLRDHPRYVALCQRMGLDAQNSVRALGRRLDAP